MQRSKFEKLVRQFPFLREIAPDVREGRHDAITGIFVKRIDVDLLGSVGREDEDYRISFYVISRDLGISTLKRERVVVAADDREVVVDSGDRIGAVLGRCIVCDLREIVAIVREDWYGEIPNERDERFFRIYLPPRNPRDWKPITRLLDCMEDFYGRRTKA